jgi:hypothetical protein
MVTTNAVPVMNQFTDAVIGTPRDSAQGPKISVNTIIIDQENGTISKIMNTSQMVQGYNGVVKLLQNQTANTYSPNVGGIIINKVTGTTLITKDLNSTNYAVADEIRKTAGDRLNWVYFCYIETVYSNGIPIHYIICPGLLE